MSCALKEKCASVDDGSVAVDCGVCDRHGDNALCVVDEVVGTQYGERMMQNMRF